MLITLLIPTAGTARVLGYDVVKDAREVRKRIGYVFGGDRGLYERLSARDNLRHFAELYAVGSSQQKSPYPWFNLLIRRRDLPAGV
jgi:ABC-2 type transport system ATP-binding protein